MSTAAIPQLTVAISLTGAEWLEVAQLRGVGPAAGYGSFRVTSAQIALLAAQISPTGPTGVATDTPSGTVNNYTVNGEFGPTIGFVDLTPTANVLVTGMEAGFDGQIATYTNLAGGGFTVTLGALNGGSLLMNQFRLPANRILNQYNSQSFKYSATIGLWVALNG